jgi:large subunit ribosomal protein L25
MAAERVKLEVKPRENGGSPAARRLRAAGAIPGVLYGGGKPAQPFSVGERELRRVLTGSHGLHAIIDVVVEGTQKPHHAVLKEYQLHPVKNRLLHVDLQEVRLDQAIQAQVVVELTGEAQGVTEGGVLQQSLREVNVEALPMDVPDRIELDVSALNIGDNVRVSDLPPIENVSYLDDPETTIASVIPPTLEPEEPEEEEVSEEELAEGEVPAEGEAEGGAEEGTEPDGDAAGERKTSDPEG